MLAVIQPVMTEASWLSTDLAASHVVRSAVCLLAGLPVIAERKSKGARHQHSGALAEPLESLLEQGKFFMSSDAGASLPLTQVDCLH